MNTSNPSWNFPYNHVFYYNMKMKKKIKKQLRQEKHWQWVE
jgi:hypothetical protein